jgi:hypothetical protein
MADVQDLDQPEQLAEPVAAAVEPAVESAGPESAEA